MAHPKAGSLYHGDCIEVMRTLDAASVDAIVTDPPYGLEFMGREWDKLGGDARMTKPGIGERHTAWASFGGASFGGANPTCAVCGGRLRGERLCGCEQPDWRVKGEPPSVLPFGPAMQAWHAEWATEALRVLKPGGHLVAFGGTRTYHRMVCAIEDAGFEIRDCLQWLYGQGFPKSLDVSKAIDKAAGVEREVVGTYRVGGNALTPTSAKGGTYGVGSPNSPPGDLSITAPATDAAHQWNGWGTALKPAQEPIVLARKPLSERSVAANVLRWGTGAINVDGCRIGHDEPGGKPSDGPTGRRAGIMGEKVFRHRDTTAASSTGRWPSNVLLDEEAAVLLDEQSGERRGGGQVIGGDREYADIGYGGGVTRRIASPGRGDRGGAARFFYTAKASAREKSAGLAERNGHPTVKPVALMGWLIKLVTPPGGLILDPFLGSGTTALAAIGNGFDWIGIEREDEYCQIAAQRIGLGCMVLEPGRGTE